MTLNELIDEIDLQGEILVKVWDFSNDMYVLEKPLEEIDRSSLLRGQCHICHLYPGENCLVVELPLPEYDVKVTSVTYVSVNALDEEQAKEIACAKAWELDADEQDAEIV